VRKESGKETAPGRHGHCAQAGTKYATFLGAD